MYNLPPIAFFIGSFPKISESWFLEQVVSLINLGIDIRIFAFRRGEAEDMSEVVEQYKLIDRTTYLEYPDSFFFRIFLAPYFFFRIIRANPRVWFKIFKPGHQYDFSLKYLFWTAPLLGKIEDCAIVHCHFGMIANRYLLIKDLLELKQPFVTTFYGQDSSKYIQEKGQTVYDRLKNETRHLFTMTKEMTQRMIRFGFPVEKVHELYTGLILKNFYFKERSYRSGEKFKIVFIGRFVEKKGVPDLLRATGIVVKSHPHIEVHVFGGGNDFKLNEEIKHIVREEGIEPHVIFHGMTSNNIVRKMLYDMHLSVQLSKTATNGDTDDLPVAILEAQATGLPVVSTRHVGIPDGVLDGETGFLVPEGDYRAAAEKIMYFIEHPEIIPKMSRRARAFIEERFDIVPINHQLIGYYQELLNTT